MIMLYGIPNCGSVKKAKQWLQAEGFEFTFHDFKKHGVPEQELVRWINEAGAERLVNKRGTTWRKLAADQQARADLPEALAVLLTQHSSLIKRPVITQDKLLLIGFDKALMQQLRQPGKH